MDSKCKQEADDVKGVVIERPELDEEFCISKVRREEISDV